MINLKLLSICATVLAISATGVLTNVNDDTTLDTKDNPTIALSECSVSSIALDNAKNQTTASIKNNQEMVWHKMLNSIDYYDSISGTTVYNVGKDINNCMVINFESDVETGKAFTTVEQINSSKPYDLFDETSAAEYNLKSNVTIVSDGESVYELDNLKRTYTLDNNAVVKREDTSSIPDDERYWINEDGEPCCFYRGDATNTGYAKRCIFSQELAIGYLHDFNLWSVDSIDEYNGRKCYLISGTADEEYGKKLNVEKFKLCVDFETGVLLKYEGYSSDGELTHFLYTDNIKINEGISPIVMPNLSKYTEIE